MLQFIQRFLKTRYLSIQTKLTLPLGPAILILFITILPITNRILVENLEQEANRQLIDIATSATDVIQSSETLARNNAILIAQQPTIISAFNDLPAARQSLEKTKVQLGLQELSLYSSNVLNGESAFYYGGPMITRRLQVSTTGTTIRGNAILDAINKKEPSSEVIITPQGSQVIGTAPVFANDNDKVIGVVLTAYFLDDTFIENVSQIIGADIGIVKNNAVIVSTIGNKPEYEKLINEGWLKSDKTPSTNIEYEEKTYHILANKLVISGNSQGYLLVAQPIDHLFILEKNIRFLFIVVFTVFSFITLWFWWASIRTFTRPLSELTSATTKISKGSLNEHIRVNYLFFRDEITILSENFNTMVENLHTLYINLEEKVAQRTKELEIAASTDDLTMAYNRRYFIQAAQRELEQAKIKHLPLSLILFDVDDFKNINDTYGHLHGDEVLREISRHCSKNLRPNDVFARYGGEEFILLLVDTDNQTAQFAAERLRKVVAKSKIKSNLDISITISIGVATYNGGDTNLEDLLRKADNALYKAKDAGKNCVRSA